MTANVQKPNWKQGNWTALALFSLGNLVWEQALILYYPWTRISPPAGSYETSREEVCWGSGTNNYQCQTPYRPLTGLRCSRLQNFLRARKRSC